MSLRSISNQEQQLNDFFHKAKEFDTLHRDQTMLSHWARYLCVLVSGYLENSVQEIFTEYAAKCANENVANFVAVNLDNFQNPKMDLILQSTGRFNTEWEQEMRVKV